LGLAAAGLNDFLGLETPQFINKITNTNVFLVINSIIGVAAGGAAFSTVNNGISKLLDGKPDSDTMVSLLLAGSILLSCVMFADTNMVKFGYVQIMVPVAVAALFFNVCGKTMRSARALKNFKIFSGARNKYAVFSVDDDEATAALTRGMFTVTPVLAAYKETEFASDFIKKTNAPDVTDRFAKTSMPAVMIAGAVLGIITGFMTYGEIKWACIYAGISVFFTVCAVASGFISAFVVGSVSSSEAAKLRLVGSVMPGYDGAEEFADVSALVLDARALYPHGSIGLLGVKLFTDTRLDEAIVEAASLTHQAGSVLDTMFYDIIRGKTELLNPVESFIYEDSLGLCGWINNRRVLLGNRLLMINHSINGLPPEAKEAEYTGRKKSAVYLSIAGELSAMFIVDLIPNVEIADALLELQKKNVNIILRTVDSILTIAKISDMFDISPEYIKLLPFRYSETFDEVTEYSPRISANAVSTGNITGIAAIFTSAKKIRAAALSGLTLQMAAMVIGLVIMLAMLIFGKGREMSVLFITAYNLAFLIILTLIHSIGKLFP
jgi:Cu+-exporting ATPase